MIKLILASPDINEPVLVRPSNSSVEIMNSTCLVLVLILILTIVYWFWTKNYNHWQKQNVPCVADKPIPGIGNMFSVITLRENMTSYINKLYKQTDSSMIGFYFVQRPGLIVRDPELVKTVMHTNFTNFHNNLIQLNEKTETDPVFLKNPFFATDLEKWKTARTRTNTHLKGKKLSQLHVFLQEVCSKMIAHTNKRITENGGIYESEMKNYFYKYTGEFVANAAFAIEGQSFEDNPSPVSFAGIVNSILSPTVINGIKLTLMFYFPTIGNFLRLSIMEGRMEKYLRQNLKVILDQRKKLITPPIDYLQYVLDANGEQDMDSIIADILIFFGDVYETPSTVLAVLSYHLSKNTEIQDKLRNYIKSVLKNSNGVLTYDSLKNMDYLDQVIYESMRMVPALGNLQKVCTEKTTLTGPDGVSCNLNPGDPIFIPLLGLQNDPKYWTNPEVFDPERFSPENQANRPKYLFFPFGEGPRMCIGMRLGMMVIKQGIVSLLTNFSVEYSPKNREPFEWEPTLFLTYNKGGMWTRLKKLPPEN